MDSGDNITQAIIEDIADGTLDLFDEPHSWSLPEGSSVDLTALLSKWFSTGSLPSVTCKTLEIEVDAKDKSFTFSGKLASDWILTHVDGKTMTVTGLAFSLERSASETSGTIEGTWELGGAELATTYTFGEGRVFQATWNDTAGASLGLDTITAELGLPAEPLPSGLDVTLTEVAIEYDRGANQFAVKAQAGKGHDAFLIASDSDNGWEVAWGVALDLAEGVPSGALGTIFNDASSLGLESVSAVFASSEDDGFTLDDFLNDPDFPLLGTTEVNLDKGLNLKALIAFKTTGNVLAKALGTVLGGDELAIEINTTTPVQVTADLGTPKLSLVKGMHLTDANLDLTLGDEPSCSIDGEMLLPLGSDTTELTAQLTVDESELQVNLDWADKTGGLIKAPFLLKGVTVTDLSGSFGVDFQNPGLVVGLEGTFTIVGETGSNDCAIVVDFGAELIDPLAFKADIGELSIEVIVAAIRGSKPSLPAPLNHLSVTDASFHWAQSDTILPDGTTVTTGFGFKGYVDLFGLKFYAMLDVSTDHLSGLFAMAPWPSTSSPIHNVLRISGDGKGVTVNKQELVAPGGPNFLVSTVNEPHLHASVNIWLLGASLDAVVNITDQHVAFDVTVDIGSSAHADLSCTLANDVFDATADIVLNLDEHIDLKIGDLDVFTFHLVCGLDGSLSIHHDGTNFSGTITGGFEFEGTSYQLPTLSLDANIEINNLASWIVEKIKAEVSTIFSDMVDEAEDAWKKIKADADKIASKAKQTVDQIKQDTEQAVQATEKVAKELSAEAQDLSKEAQALVQDGKTALDKAARDVTKIAKSAATDVKNLGNAAENVTTKAAQAVERIASEVAGDVQALEDEGKKVVAEAEQFASNLAHEATAAVQQLEAAATQTVDQIIGDAESTARKLEAEANKILSDIASAAKKAVHAVSHWFHKLF